MIKSMDVSLVGMRFYSPPYDIFKELKNNSAISLIREPENIHDSNAVAAKIKGHKIGHLDKKSASIISPLLERGAKYTVKILWVGSGYKSVPLHITIEIGSGIVIAAPKVTEGKKAGIYKITSLNHDFIYIGQSININKRISSHWKELSLGIHINKKLQKEWNERSHINIVAEVVEYAPITSSELELKRWLGLKEEYWINKFRLDYNCINILDGEIVHSKTSQVELYREERLNDEKHDLRVKERKAEINTLLRDLTAKLNEYRSPREQYSKIAHELEAYLKSNTGLRGFFFGTNDAVKVRQKQVELDKINSCLNEVEAKISQINSDIAKLKKEHSELKTSKQLERLVNRILLRGY